MSKIAIEGQLYESTEQEIEHLWNLKEAGHSREDYTDYNAALLLIQVHREPIDSVRRFFAI